MNSVTHLIEHPETLCFIHRVYLRFLTILRKTISSRYFPQTLRWMFSVPEAQCTVYEVGICVCVCVCVCVYIYIYMACYSVLMYVNLNTSYEQKQNTISFSKRYAESVLQCLPRRKKRTSVLQLCLVHKYCHS